MDLPRLFATTLPLWGEGDRLIPGVGRVPVYSADDWLRRAIREQGGGRVDDWTLLMARACCRVLGELDGGTRADEMAEHLPEALHDEWVDHREFAAWIAHAPVEAFGRIDAVQRDFEELDMAQAVELAMQQQAAWVGSALIRAAEAEWTSRACRTCGAYPFHHTRGCVACTPRVREA